MEWTKQARAFKTESPYQKKNNSAKWLAECGGFMFEAWSDRRARHGGWVLRWADPACPHVRQTRSFAKFSDAKRHADRLAC